MADATDGGDELVFDKATPAATGAPAAAAAAAAAGTASAPPGPAAVACVACRAPIVGQYYEAGGKVICPNCRARYAAQMTAPAGRAGRMAKAAALGVAAAVVCALVWWGIRELTGYELGIVAVVVGIVVGGAVRSGSGGRGGPWYQAIAIAITYLAIAGSFVPDIGKVVVKSLNGGPHATAAAAAAPARPTTAKAVDRSTATDEPAGEAAAAADDDGREPRAGAVATHTAPRTWTPLKVILLSGLVFVFALRIPILLGTSSPISGLIMLFALYEAWKVNKRRQVVFSGPFVLGGPPGTSPPPPPFAPGVG